MKHCRLHILTLAFLSLASCKSRYDSSAVKASPDDASVMASDALVSYQYTAEGITANLRGEFGANIANKLVAAQMPVCHQAPGTKVDTNTAVFMTSEKTMTMTCDKNTQTCKMNIPFNWNKAPNSYFFDDDDGRRMVYVWTDYCAEYFLKALKPEWQRDTTSTSTVVAIQSKDKTMDISCWGDKSASSKSGWEFGCKVKMAAKDSGLTDRKPASFVSEGKKQTAKLSGLDASRIWSRFRMSGWKDRDVFFESVDKALIIICSAPAGNERTCSISIDTTHADFVFDPKHPIYDPAHPTWKKPPTEVTSVAGGGWRAKLSGTDAEFFSHLYGQFDFTYLDAAVDTKAITNTNMLSMLSTTGSAVQFRCGKLAGGDDWNCFTQINTRK